MIGAGMAGAMAAHAARDRGARVVVVRRGWGATAVSSGAVDVAAGRAPLDEAIRALGRGRPWHPYGVLGARLESVREGLEFASSKLQGLLSRPAEANFPILTQGGRVKHAAVAQASQVLGRLDGRWRKIGIVHFGFADRLDAEEMAKGIGEWALREGRKVEVTVVACPFFQGARDAQKTAVALAGEIDTEGSVEKVAALLSERVPAGTDLILLPPCIGAKVEGLALAIGARLGIPCAEALGRLPSVPGLRLQEALDRSLRTAGVEIVDGEVAWNGEGEGLGFFRVGERTLQPASAVLATGRFLGGGVVSTGGFREALFGLPVYSGPNRLRRQYEGRLLAEEEGLAQPLFSAGVRVDSALRPLGEAGTPFCGTLFAAGSVIGGYDPAAGEGGLGIAAWTGFLAGASAAACA